MKEGGDTVDERIAFAFEAATARLPRPGEERILRALYEEQRSDFAAEPDQARALVDVGEAERDGAVNPVELAAWTTVASTVLNLDETITKS